MSFINQYQHDYAYQRKQRNSMSYEGIAINLFPLNYKNYRIALRVF